MSDPQQHTETDRLAALSRFNILDTAPEPRYDRLTQLAAYLCQTPIAIISLVDRDRVWFKSTFGVSQREIPREDSFCAEVAEGALMVKDARLDPRFADNPLVTGETRIRFYAGVALTTSDGHALGTISVLDTVPRELSAEQLTGLQTLAHQVITQMELHQANAMLQELACKLREAESALRSVEAELSEEKAARADHAQQLLQANEHLVVATIDAHVQFEEIEQAKLRMAYLAQHDALTDLPNRAPLNERLTQAISLAQRQGKQFALMFLDMDHFKDFNDTLGHAVGDQLLQSAAKRLLAAVRGSDTVSRLGGDEFVILLADVEHPRDAALSAQKILDAFAATHRIGQFELRATFSIGISIYPDDGKDALALINCADSAMYQAKDGGRNNYRFFRQP